MPDRDVIVAGAGPVGALLACLLAAQGFDVLVCERHSGPDARSRAIGIHPPGLAALDAAGVGDAVRREGLTLDGGEVQSRGRTLARVDFGRQRPVLTLAQHRTQALLAGRLAESGATVLRGAEVTGFEDRGDRVGVLIARHGTEHDITAALLVAADGVRSRLRHAAGIGWRSRRGRARYAMADLPGRGDDAIARVHCEPAGLVESFPLPGGARRWVVRERAGAPLRSAAAFQAEILARLGAAPAMPSNARPSRFGVSQHTAARMVQGRLVLIGDAAHETSPIGGQGMNLGWVDALRLAEALGTQTLHRPGALQRFQGERLAAARVAQRRAAFYMSMGAPATGAALSGRDALIRLLGSPVLRGRSADLVTMRGL
ncbi:FAD-dependent oxidoreductase [Microbacterium sp.]|uniref:FAD-dependent oxidoreductase n=1 Tax=Microbacterium sp. TaxID=51671 RepID=UPI0028128952|nr:NAD(P)/FAD-dependent oxidoreductase [Microbacterium sp.]